MNEQQKCSICGEPMPIGEEMFKFHGYSGDCPKPPLKNETFDIPNVLRNKDNLIRELEAKNSELESQLVELDHCREVASHVEDIDRQLSSIIPLEEAVMKIVTKFGGIRAASRETGVDKSFISRLLSGQKTAPSCETLKKLGLEAAPLYKALPQEVKK